MQNIGIVLYTKGNNSKNLKNALSSIEHLKDQTIVVCDGSLPNLPALKDFNVKEFKTSINSAGCYNYGIRHLLDKEVDHIFILGDQIMILDDSVFQNYIDVSEQTNIEFLAYSRDEDDPFGEKNNNRLTIELKEGKQLLLSKGFNSHLMYCRKNVFEKVGFFDERYRSSFEASDFYKRCGDKGLTTPFGWFADITEKENILYQENRPDKIHSTINSDTVEDRFIRGLKVFNLKYQAQFQELLNIFSQKDVISKLKLLASRK